MNLRRFWSIIKKEFIQIKRDRASFGIAIMMPVVMMLLFGYAVSTELDDISLLVLDQSKTAESRDLIKSFENTQYFKVAGEVNNLEEIYESLDSGSAHSAVIIPPDFETKLNRRENPSIQLLIDGSDPTTARTALSSGILSAQQHGIKVLSQMNEKTPAAAQTGGININTRVLYNPSMRNQNFTIPGLIGLIMQNITIILTAFSLVRERERGTIEQLMVSPLKRWEIILGKLIPYIIIGFFDFLYALALGLYWFNVPSAGNIGLLLLLGSGFVICALAIGILISTISKTQLQAMQMAVLVLLPSVLLSGFIFPREAMPTVIQWIGYALPLTYFLNILRGIILKGLDLNYLFNDVLLLFILGLALLILSIVRFRKRLD
jgi:ABC-2 type transport system permease protein